MPRNDGTGPVGQGPLTGRGLGRCLGYGVPMLAGAFAGFLMGRGRGMRRGRGGWSGAGQEQINSQNLNFTETEELSVLKNQADTLQDTLNKVKDRISELEKQ